MPEPAPHATSPPQLASPNGPCARRVRGVRAVNRGAALARASWRRRARARVLSTRTGG